MNAIEKRSRPTEQTLDQATSHREEPPSPEGSEPFDYTYVSTVARIALYDDLRSAPRVTEIPPAETLTFIENLAAKVYEQSKGAGGAIPYTVIREVSENFIHAKFKEIIVSILDGGNTIRFADQGPGINHKDKAQLPGFSSAIEPMKKYIRGVGSGLPIVKEYLEFSHGNITIEDNMGAGSVVTISMAHDDSSQVADHSIGNAPDAIPSGTSAISAAPDAGVTPSTLSSGTSLPNAASSNMTAGGTTTAGFNDAAYRATTSAQMQGTWSNAGHYSANPAMTADQAYHGYAPEARYSGAASFYPDAGVLPYGVPYAGGTGGAFDLPNYASHVASRVQMAIAPLSTRERDFLPLLLDEGPLGVTDISKYTDTPQSSTYVALKKLEESGLVEKTAGQKRILTPLGRDVAQALRSQKQ